MKLENYSSRNVTLDSIRAVAVILVLLNHAYLPSIKEDISLSFSLLMKIMSKFKMGGWTGVDLFFMMSGFLISGLLFKELKTRTHFDIKNFLIRRGFKIYPSFIAFIFIASGIEIYYSQFYSKAFYPISFYIHDFFFLNNYLVGRWDHTWSLDVEEAFYLLFPFFLLILLKARSFTLKSIVLGYLSLVLIAIIFRLFANINTEYSFRYQFTLTHLRLDALFFGVLLSYMYQYRLDLIDKIMVYKKFFIPICLLGVLLNFMFWKGGMKSVITLSLNPIFYGLLMIYALKAEMLNYKYLAYIGKYSYNIYLWHYPLYNYSEELIKLFNINITSTSGYVMYLIIYLIIGVGLGILFSKIVEEPFLKIRDKYFPSYKEINKSEKGVKSLKPSVA